MKNELLAFARDLESAVSAAPAPSASPMQLTKVDLTADEARLIAETKIPPTGYVLYVPSLARDNLARALAL